MKRCFFIFKHKYNPMAAIPTKHILFALFSCSALPELSCMGLFERELFKFK